MSSFFRSIEDISESGEDTSEYEQTSLSETRDHDEQSHERALSIAPAGSEVTASFQQNVLFASLLEDKCLADVCDELNVGLDSNRYTKDHPRVKGLAAERYKAVSAQLSSHGLAPAGFELEDFRQVRQRARDGLSLLSQNINAMRISEPDQDIPQADSKALVRNAPIARPMDQSEIGNTMAFDPAVSSLAMSALSPPRQQIPHPLTATHPLIDSTRYARDFEEIGMLGKGGYGTVHHCNHRLDGTSYAVKKIPLGSAVLYRVQQQGPSELNAILNELRTMARMEHPNIVRYYGGWIEWSSTQTDTPRSVRKRSLLRGPDAVAGADADEAAAAIEFSPINTIDGSSQMASVDDDDGIIFEDSLSHGSAQTLSDSRSANNAINGNELQPIPSRNTIASVSDDEIEYVTRNDTTSLSLTDTNAESSDPSTPSLTLHIQMSLYPLTLSDYLRPAPLDTVSKTAHCFHLPASLDILLALLSGVEYLHTQSTVHRDLKPANIFLSPQAQSSQPIAGSISPSSCSACPVSSRPESMKLCIGDFGLVTAIKASPSSSPGKGVGTELYRPPLTVEYGPASPGLDIYALGIILFELVYAFQTRMERHDMLTRLRRGEFPEDFGGRIGILEAEVRKLINDMLGTDSEAAVVGCTDVRRRVGEMSTLLQKE